MYIIRSALRASTGRPPARFIRGRRYPSIPRLRTFHTTRPLAQASNPPPAPDNKPIDPNGVNKSDLEKSAAEEVTDAAAATDDPEVLAQKLQRSRETSRRYSAALRRQQRGKKAQGLPPVHIPDWFLKKSVIRHQDLNHGAQQLRPRAVLSVDVSHAESGEHAACSIPVGGDIDPAQALSRLVRGLWSRRLDDHEKRKVKKYLEERAALVEKAESANVPGANTESTSTSKEGHADVITEDTAFNEAWMKLNKLSNDIDLDPRKKMEAMRRQSAKLERAAWRREVAKTWQMGTSRRLSSLVVAEIRATIAASLSTLRPAAGDSFPSAKTNLVLHSPAAEHEKSIDDCVYTSALEVGSDVIVLHAQDLAQLAADYLGEGPEPSPRSIRSLGYETYRLSAELNNACEDVEEVGEDESDQHQPSSADQSEPGAMRGMPFRLPIIAVTPALRALTQSLKHMHVASASPFEASAGTANEESGRAQSQSELQLEDMKLAALLDALVDSNDAKQSRGIVGDGSPQSLQPSDHSRGSSKSPAFFDYSMSSEGTELDFNSTLPTSATPGISMAIKIGSMSRAPEVPKNSKIIYVKDFKELNATYYGGRIIQKLEELVRKRRTAGESIMIVGNTCSRDLTPELSASGVRGLQSEGESSFFRTIVIAAESSKNETSFDESRAAARNETASADLPPAEKSKFRRINLSHIQDMLRSLDPVAAASISDMEKSVQHFRSWAPIFSDSYFNRVLTYDEVHRIALTSLGLLITSPNSEAATSKSTPSQLTWAHVALSMGLLKASDIVKYAYFDRAAEMPKRPQNAFETRQAQAEAEMGTHSRPDEKSLQRQRNLQRIASTATKHEKRLMPGIADPDQIKTTFEQVHVPKETVDSIRTITSLSLLRPEAFSYGILATEKISGALLYGPPGTGKTLLAKAVAKESGSSVLEVSGSQIMDKYVGEGEKNVAAIFSLARKMSPCIVFLDEADAVFASRDAMRERASHRDILNQFLKEWDGLNDLSVFVMVATNRPFDLDDAVIRRLPRRLLVDLPTQTDRKEILRIHLKGEQLDDSVDLEDISKRTPFYSGSDLKNIAVSAALACVKEENEQAAIAAAKASLETEPSSPSESTTESTTDSSISLSSDSISTSPISTQFPSPPSQPQPLPPHLVRGQSYIFPEKRILHARHFDKALQEISASISEDMSSLSAIKKFDEQYGDRKGNKRKKDFGFGVLAERNESAARVRI
ncbi:AAA-domain-containing protein [Cucurbitaria berberidis CBS 394.84]|uniref:AAA-domain-containing protein n=1 Tax=Cucurbitaria berberidis CBS 394.84 TaxID=1168544 RepID=A0A9P4LEE4_9PLEO|nr:AAA-domain-containing protein [Cucurbitaria berberidis CBS 394.84]KAF1851960.1 AAA-domain-containing protein [Cucurbitaria berberidis CBS 394.84]